jgi:hypothetical protein
MTGAERKIKRIAAITRTVELCTFVFKRCAIMEPACVVHCDVLTLRGFCAATSSDFNYFE